MIECILVKAMKNGKLPRSTKKSGNKMWTIKYLYSTVERRTDEHAICHVITSMKPSIFNFAFDVFSHIHTLLLLKYWYQKAVIENISVPLWNVNKFSKQLSQHICEAWGPYNPKGRIISRFSKELINCMLTSNRLYFLCTLYLLRIWSLNIRIIMLYWSRLVRNRYGANRYSLGIL